MNYQNHQRIAKKRMRAIRYTRGQDKKAQLYRDLIAVTRKSLGYLQEAAVTLHSVQVHLPLDYNVWQQQVVHFRLLVYQVIEQTERRIFEGEKVPASEKMVSIFEAYTDIIVKGARDVRYGHKLNLSTGRSGLILDVVIE